MLYAAQYKITRERGNTNINNKHLPHKPCQPTYHTQLSTQEPEATQTYTKHKKQPTVPAQKNSIHTNTNEQNTQKRTHRQTNTKRTHSKTRDHKMQQ